MAPSEPLQPTPMPAENGEPAPMAEEPPTGEQAAPLPEQKAEGPEEAPIEQFFCLAQNQEEAERIASGYGVTLVSYDSGVAVFESGESLQALLDRGEPQGLPVLEQSSEITG